MKKKKVIFTTGTFDTIHYGHINLLEKSKEYGDYLIVGLNVTKNGNPTYFSYEERKKILESIKFVDKVVPIYAQEDKFKYMDGVDFFTIGSDYIGHPDIKEIEKYTKVIFIDRTPDVCSTNVKKYLSDTTEYKTYVIDVDDTISYTYNRDFENSVPNEEVIEKINELYDNGWNIVLFTARGAKSCKTLEERINKYDKITRKWLANHNVKYNQLLFGKPNADYYVDDKNITVEDFIKMPVRKIN